MIVVAYRATSLEERDALLGTRRSAALSSLRGRWCRRLLAGGLGLGNDRPTHKAQPCGHHRGEEV